MTLEERGRLGNEVMANRASQRAEALRRHLEHGEAFKRAAWKAGVSIRTARRYRQEFRHR